jgi:hypothetical protein
MSAVTDAYQMFVSVNVWERQGKAMMEVYQSSTGGAILEPIQEFWADVNIDNNTLNCAVFQPKK